MTLTVYSFAVQSTSTYVSILDTYGYYSFTPGSFVLPDIQAGDVITVESGSWSGVVHVMTMTVQPQLDLDQITGAIEPPTNRVELSGGNSNSDRYPIGGWFDTLTTAGSPFTATLAAFDLHLNQTYDLNHRTADDYVERISRETGGVAALLPANVVLANFFEPGIAFTITLRDSGDNFKAQIIGRIRATDRLQRLA